MTTLDNPIIQARIVKMIAIRSDKTKSNFHVIDVNNFLRKNEILNVHTYTTDKDLISIISYVGPSDLDPNTCIKCEDL